MSNLTTAPASDETKERSCVECQKQFTLPKYGVPSYEIRCPDCLQGKVNRDKEQQQKAVEAVWLSRCPKQFQDTNIDKLPCQEEVRRALDWKCGPVGLLLHGPTGGGKTRTAWLVLRNQHLKGKQFKILNSLAGLEYASKFSESASIVENWVSGLIETDILFMDDVFKNKFTDSFEGVVFSIIDRRTENGRPVILTANDTGASLTNRMTDDRGEPLVRRLREFCLDLTFKPQ